MASRGQQDDVATAKHTAVQVGPVTGIEIHAEPAALDDQNLLRIAYVPLHDVVHVGIDHLAPGVVHVGELLGELVGRQEVHPLARKAMAEDDGQQLLIVRNLLEHHWAPSLVKTRGLIVGESA